MKVDITVVGGGLVGNAFALAAAASGVNIALIEGRAPSPVPTDANGASWDSRIYAISPGSKAFLERLGVWQQLDPMRIAPVVAMRVWGDAGAQLDFDALQAGGPALAYILENRALQNALWRSVQACEQVQCLCPAQGVWLDSKLGRPLLKLADGAEIESALLVGADGADSWVRENAGFAAEVSPYGYSGVVANFLCERPHGGMARQWFREDGVLAWLPLPGKRISMVWSTPESNARDLLELSPPALCAAVEAAGGGALGALSLIAPAAAFPLRLIRLLSTVKPGIALIGDAAHAMHPLAGQGVNTGFADAQVLARVLRERPAPAGCGDLAVLRRYQRARKEEVAVMQWVTDGLHHLFKQDQPLLRAARNLGLGLTDRMDFVKRQLMWHAMH